MSLIALVRGEQHWPMSSFRARLFNLQSSRTQEGTVMAGANEIGWIDAWRRILGVLSTEIKIASFWLENSRSSGRSEAEKTVGFRLWEKLGGPQEWLSS